MDCGGLTYLYKLQCAEFIYPDIMKQMVPSRGPLRAIRDRTGLQIEVAAADIGYGLLGNTKPKANNALLRSFPNAVIPLWNRIPREDFQDDMCLKNMQKFKRFVHNWMKRS